MTETQRTAEHTRTALITGASRGIGYELIKLFASDGYDVVLVARSHDRLEQISAELEETYNITATVISQDLSLPRAAEELYDATSAEELRVDTLVGECGPEKVEFLNNLFFGQVVNLTHECKPG